MRDGSPLRRAQGRPRTPARIAHAYGNRRESIQEALTVGADTIEADVWYRAGDLWVRHEHRLGPIPLLYDRRPPGVRRIGPWAFPLGFRFYLRLELRPLPLGELMERVRGRRRLLLDVKGQYNPGGDAAYARRLGSLVEEFGCGEGVTVCGQNWSVVRQVKETLPQVAVRYSIGTARQWLQFLHLLAEEEATHGVCIDRHLLDEEKAHLLREKGIGFYCWTVDDADEARRLLGAGAEGIISNNLSLLASLASLGERAG